MADPAGTSPVKLGTHAARTADPQATAAPRRKPAGR
jgi:hypothetical protein